ncbi:MAG: hypothetical protein NW201_14225 [Gemmatimonadales bacterium]|nr:hypothetical protein [Gemmatimonadales bacterium]
MRRLTQGAAAIAMMALAACSSDRATEPQLTPTDDKAAESAVGWAVRVTNSNDDGPGSLRAAIAVVNGSTRTSVIQFDAGLAPILLLSPVTYTGPQPLTLLGRGVVLDGTSTGGDVFVATGGGNLTLQDITVQKGTRHGVLILVPATRTGTQSLRLANAHILDNRLHGVYMQDQVLDPALVVDQAPNAFDSPASLQVTVVGGSVLRNGLAPGRSDFDGIRINEGGAGDLRFSISGTVVKFNGADGIETDERGTGSVIASASSTTFDQNGPNDPLDPDDGWDIDEAGEGDINATVSGSTFNGNFDEGLDVTELDGGSILASVTDVVANGNTDEGVKFTESAGGDLTVNLTRVTNNDTVEEEGIQVEELGEGNVVVTFTDVTALRNGASHPSAEIKENIDIRERDGGNLTATWLRVAANASANDDGAVIDERGAGNLSASITSSEFRNNALQSLELRESDAGTGAATLTSVIRTGNLVSDAVRNTGGVTITIVP